MTRTVPVERIDDDEHLWPRTGLDEARAQQFAFPPALRVASSSAERHPAGGRVPPRRWAHRLEALRIIGAEQAEVEVVEPDPGEDVGDAVLRIAIETAARSSLPLSKADQRRAVKLLHARRRARPGGLEGGSVSVKSELVELQDYFYDTIRQRPHVIDLLWLSTYQDAIRSTGSRDALVLAKWMARELWLRRELSGAEVRLA